MARRVFFSFHYERDVWRAGQVRNSWVTKADRESAGFWDAAAWEEVKRNGDDAIKRWIDRELNGTSVTVVLVGAETSQRPYVKYEIEQSVKRGNGLAGIYINNIRDSSSRIDTKGASPFSDWSTPVYDWVSDDGRNNIGDWIEAAAKKAGR